MASHLHKTVAELDRTLSADEFDHWMAFDALDPIGNYRFDVNFAHLCQLIANINRAPNSSSYDIDNFLLFPRSFVDPIMDNDAIAETLAQIFKIN